MATLVFAGDCTREQSFRKPSEALTEERMIGHASRFKSQQALRR